MSKDYLEFNLAEVKAFSKDESCARVLYAEIERLRGELSAERAIVSRIWVQLGSPTYTDLKGRSIYDLIDEIKTDRAEAKQEAAHYMSVAQKATDELACEKENRNHLIEKGGKLETELAAAKAECNRLYESSPTALDALTAELARLRAELAVAQNWVEHHSKHADDLIGENVKLRADLERFTGHGLLDCHAICDQRDAAIAERDQLRAEVEALKQSIESGQRVLREDAERNAARAERAEVERAYVERLKKQIRDDNLGYACEL